MMLKIAIAEAAQEAGWQADMEVQPDGTDIGGWRADVLAIEPGTNRRFAFEIQHSRMTTEDGRQRTANYEQDGIGVLWVATSIPTWLWRFPAILVDVERSVEDGRSNLTATVRAGAANFKHYELMSPTRSDKYLKSRSEWHISRDLDLGEVISRVLNGELVDHNLTLSEKARPWGRVSKSERQALTVALVNPTDIEAETNYLQTQRELVVESHGTGFSLGGLPGPRSKDVPGLRRRNFVPITMDLVRSPLLERQTRVLHVLLPEAQASCRPGEVVWVGLPPRPVGLNMQLIEAAGSDEMAKGALIWLGATEDDVRPFGVISPVRHLLSPTVGTAYRERGFRVFVDGDYEAELLAEALGWPVGEVQVRFPTM